jgi:hypothetical protein
MSERTATPGPSAATASADLVGQGWHLRSADTVSRLLGVGDAEWAAYADHWDDLVLDTYMKDGGTYATGATGTSGSMPTGCGSCRTPPAARRRRSTRSTAGSTGTSSR